MINQQTLEGHWNEIRGKLKQKWGSLTDAELKGVEGNIDQLVGLVQRKTGESRQAVERYLDEMGDQFGSLRQQVGEKAKEAGEKVKETAGHVRDSLETGYRETENLVKTHPAESVVVAFGTGMLVGVILGLALGRGD